MLHNNLNLKLFTNILSIPTYSKYEYRMTSFIIKWCKNNNILVTKDKYNNLYLTKGYINKNEYYPCITAHLDTFYKEHLFFIKNNKKLPLCVESYKNKTKFYCKKFGIGGDNKCGIIIALSILKKLNKCKVILFAEEELSLKGSLNFNEKFLKDVGYLISFDLPSNKSAYSCVNNNLFTIDFYFKYLKFICDYYGYNKFINSPATDIINIRNKTNIQCMIFGSGFYLPHSKKEYIIYEDVENAYNLGLSIIKKLKNKKYISYTKDDLEYKLNEMVKLNNLYSDTINKKFNNIKILLLKIVKKLA